MLEERGIKRVFEGRVSHHVSTHPVLNPEDQTVLKLEVLKGGKARTPLLPYFPRTFCNYAEEQRTTCAPVKRTTKAPSTAASPLPLFALKWKGGKKKKEAGRQAALGKEGSQQHTLWPSSSFL